MTIKKSPRSWVWRGRTVSTRSTWRTSWCLTLWRQTRRCK